MVAFSALGCPYCQGPLHATGGAGGPIQCQDCGQQFATAGGIPVLLRHEDAERFAAFSAQYRQARLDEGWQPLSPEAALALPCGQPPGCPRLYWQVRHQSFAALMGLLAREGPTPAHGPAADLGAGTGWLSYRLAQLGYEVLAVDASADADFGLGAAARLYLSRAPFALAQGDLEHPPLQRDALGLIVLNASLHYAADLSGALGRTARALQPGGRLAIVDTPVARRSGAGGTGRERGGPARLSRGSLGREELQAALEAAGLRQRWIPVRRGHRWWLHQLKAWLRRDPRFSFPLIVAEKS